ncbi:MAG TPA: hypothetical protein VGH85_21825 [Mycobacteriales bacterium]
MITTPQRLRAKAFTVSHGRDWLADLPEVCRRLSDEWSVDLGAPFADSHVSFVEFRKGDLAHPVTEWVGVIAEFCARLAVDIERVKAWMFARLVSDALAAYAEGRALAELDASQGDLWSARLVHRLRE